MFKPIVSIYFVIACMLMAPASAQEDPFSVFAPYSTSTRYRIDHQPWTGFLSRAVYTVGRSRHVPWTINSREV